MTPMRRQPGVIGPDIQAMLPPPPMQFAPPPPMAQGADATGAQALGGLANMAAMLQSRMTQPAQGGIGGAMGEMGGGGPVDAPARRKSSFGQAAQGTLNYA